jgi:Protein of unknown function (DUF5661)
MGNQTMHFTKPETDRLAKKLGYMGDLNEFYVGCLVEREHGRVSPTTNVTNDDKLMTAKIALAHLNELPNYYTLLKEMEEKGEATLKKDKKI